MTTRPPTFSIEARPAPSGLRGDDLRAWERAEYQRCVEMLASQILAHYTACDAQAERDDTNATLH